MAKLRNPQLHAPGTHVSQRLIDEAKAKRDKDGRPQHTSDCSYWSGRMMSTPMSDRDFYRFYYVPDPGPAPNRINGMTIYAGK
jgi:hypothetical protein